MFGGEAFLLEFVAEVSAQVERMLAAQDETERLLQLPA